MTPIKLRGVTRMKYMDSKFKGFIYTVLINIVVIFEMSVLSGYRFVALGSAADKYATGLTVEKVSTLKLVGANVGWNYIVCSFLIIIAMFLLAAMMGYNRNPGGMVALVVMDCVPLIGLISPSVFNFFYGYGSAPFLPAMSVFGLQNAGHRAGQIIFILIVALLTVAAWIIGKTIRSSYAKKYEY